MSLIRVRRDRKEMSGGGPKRPFSLSRLLFLLALVAGLIWWLGRLAG